MMVFVAVVTREIIRLMRCVGTFVCNHLSYTLFYEAICVVSMHLL